MTRLAPFNLQKWIASNRHLLKPPVGNKLVYAGEFKVMVVGGPNARTDYHIEAGEEWFYQLEGVLTLKLIDAGQHYEVKLGPGDTLCVPSGVAHSPQRAPGSVGIVVERERRPGEQDQLVWFCPNPECRNELNRATFVCRDLELDLKPIITNFYADLRKRTCSICGTVEQVPA